MKQKVLPYLNLLALLPVILSLFKKRNMVFY